MHEHDEIFDVRHIKALWFDHLVCMANRYISDKFWFWVMMYNHCIYGGGMNLDHQYGNKIKSPMAMKPIYL